MKVDKGSLEVTPERYHEQAKASSKFVVRLSSIPGGSMVFWATPGDLPTLNLFLSKIGP